MEEIGWHFRAGCVHQNQKQERQRGKAKAQEQEDSRKLCKWYTDREWFERHALGVSTPFVCDPLRTPRFILQVQPTRVVGRVHMVVGWARVDLQFVVGSYRMGVEEGRKISSNWNSAIHHQKGLHGAARASTNLEELVY